MSNNTSSESYRVSFSLRNPQHVREFQFLASMNVKDRHQFLHLAISSLAQKVNYTVPENGFMGMVTALLNAPSQYPSMFPAPLPPIMGDSEFEEIRKKSSASAKPKKKKPKDETKVNAPAEIEQDEDSEVADTILASLLLFDSDITDATQQAEHI